MWRQKPIPSEGLIFDDAYFEHYDELPYDKLSPHSIAYVDPTRRSARDFFSMPILREHSENGKLYLTDAIFAKKSSKDLYDEVVEKIIENKIIKLIIEENIDGSLGTVIEDRLKAKGVEWCEIKLIYNTVNKQSRIAYYCGQVKKFIVMPNKNKYSTRNPIGLMHHSLNEYSAISSNTHDDAPDSLCGVVQHFIVDGNRTNTISTSKTLPY
jgi:predicted phage terminase large subunit-like protein